MDTEKLIEELTSHNLNHPMIEPLRFWCTKCPSFKRFASNDINRNKIRNKLNEKDIGKHRDNQFELAVAYRFLSSDPDIGLKYENYGKKGPDFTVTVPLKTCTKQRDFIFNVEVKRLRDREAAKRFNEVVNEIYAVIENILPCNLRFGIEEKSMKLLDVSQPLDFIERVVKNKKKIISYIKQIISTEKQQIPLHTRKEYFFPGFEKDRFGFFLLKISHEHLPDKPLNIASHLPNLWHSKAPSKMSTIIIQKKLAQMREGEVNILFILTDSSVLEPAVFHSALRALQKKVYEKDDEHFQKNGYKGTDDFLEKFKNLSGIIFQYSNRYTLDWDDIFSKPFADWTRTPTHSIWYNPQSENNVPQEVCSYLQKVAEKKDLGFI